MRDLTRYVQARIPDEVAAKWGAYTVGDLAGNGAFLVKSPTDGKPLLVIASNGHGWDHISVSSKKRIPNWTEMEYVKRGFFEDDEVVMQLHVPIRDHINFHPHVLHLWRPHSALIPLPPKELV